MKIDLASAREVHASVRGTDVYAVMLRAGHTTLDVYCICPYFDTSGRCKHVWATLLAAEERGNLAGSGAMTKVGELSIREPAGATPENDDELYDDESDDRLDDNDDTDEDEDETDGDRARSAGPAARTWSPPPAVVTRADLPRRRDWRALLERAGRPDASPPAPTAATELRYVVDLRASTAKGGLILRIAAFDRQRDGTSAPCKPGRLRQSSIGQGSVSRTV
ncbi:MAG TPA: SWIM zinc finger family protein [Polyangia bacterium]